MKGDELRTKRGRRSNSTICEYRLAIVWRLCTATARVKAAFGLTISGGSVLCGAMAKPGTLRSSTIIEERRHEHQA